MSRLASPAMILTSAIPISESNSKRDLHGMTLSSVCSLSVYPTPCLEFNLHLPSYTSTALHQHQYLAIHIMPPTNHSAKICRVFAKGVKLNKRRGTNELNDDDDDDNDGEMFHEMTTPFTELVENQDYTFIRRVEDNVAIPVLNHAESVFICKTLHNFTTIGDHEIWVVQVVDILSQSNPTGGILYFNRGFHKIGESLLEE
ncbi:hypothetical protein KGF57_003153 [Candida theae]|uniref:Flavin reductase like domain-containing protein n=1 Tax=Candida theae TaxID=1198502 RepID=A0AAD5FY03_9ASCO|nr:uncharacterized protein KGF57_003153 [Candida theae]KAI5957459.1 hypothetical protein KGF57_003153 [Candida theae]